MIRCKHVADALADSNFMDMPRFKRLAIRMHVQLCVVCHRFHAQLIAFHKGEYRFRELEDAGGILTGQGLTTRRKNEMRKALGRACTDGTETEKTRRVGEEP